MITLHHLNNSRSHRILWLLEELSLPYEIETYERDKVGRAPRELKKIHPLGKSPVITDDGVTVAESGAIIQYLLETYAFDTHWRPKQGTEAWRRYTYWMHYAEGSLMPILLVKLLFTRITKPPVPFFIRPISSAISRQVHDLFITPNLRTHLAFIEDTLSHHNYITGKQITGADMQMSFPLVGAMARASEEGGAYPRIHAYLDRIAARGAYQRAIARGGALDLAL